MSNLFSYPQAQSVVISGDIHGDFVPLVYKMCVQYDMRDTLLIVAGDCGFGFEKPGYYEQVYKRVQNRLEKNNCWIAMIRGNHDDPSYFSEQKICHQRFRTIPDYSVIDACGHHVLCVGGAVSVDRLIRKDWMSRKPGKNYYWSDEAPLYNATLLNVLHSSGVVIDTVVTHTAPSFCEFQSKIGLDSWTIYDHDLMNDCNHERRQMDELLAHLRCDNHPVKHWYYGHFHHSWHSEIDGILYIMLDIMEFHELR